MPFRRGCIARNVAVTSASSSLFATGGIVRRDIGGNQLEVRCGWKRPKGK